MSMPCPEYIYDFNHKGRATVFPRGTGACVSGIFDSLFLVVTPVVIVCFRCSQSLGEKWVLKFLFTTLSFVVLYGVILYNVYLLLCLVYLL